MGSFIARRLLALVPLLVIITIGVYALVLLIPGDPARTLAGGLHAQPAEIVRIRHQLRLDQPFIAQYWHWLTHAVRGDLGSSLFQHQSVATGIAQRLPLTLSLALGGFVVSILLGLPAGIIAGTRPGTVADRSATLGSSVGIAMPDFWVAIILVVLFAVKLHLLPDIGYTGLARSPWGWFRHLLLPWIALGLGGGATLARQVRGELIDVLDQDYIRTARAMGVREREVIGKLALKNALTPAMTILGIQFAYLLGGTVIIEQIFSIPGLGGFILQAIDLKDLPIIQGVVLLTAVVFVVVNLIVDIAYGVLNPKGAPLMTWAVAEETLTPVQVTTGGRRLLSRLVHDRVAMTGAVFILVLVVVAILAPEVAPASPTRNFPAINAGPSSAHWLGTDDIGRDILSRVIFGARISLEAATIVVVLALIVSLPVGLAAGYFGGRTDNLLMRIMDALFAFPPLILAITVAALLGKSLHNESIAISVTFIPGFARVIRGQVLSVREETYIEASRSIGAGPLRMIRKHVLPNVASPLIVQSALAFGFALLAEAGLSFLGLGPQPPAASWGVMLQEAYQFVLSDPWATIVPGIAIALTVLSFNLVGDGLRDALGRERVAGKA